jgi:homoserine dehydrogenase
MPSRQRTPVVLPTTAVSDAPAWIDAVPTNTNVALLGYGTVGAAVDRLLAASADDIERATGHRLRLVRALVRDPGRHPDAPLGLLTTDVAEIADDAGIAVVAEVMGGLEPAGSYVLDLLSRGKHVVTANKQLVARRGPELFAAAAAGGVQLRFEASVCAAIPVIKVLREALVVTNVHRVLGIVNGTTNFVLTKMEGGVSYAHALADAQARGYAEADPRDDVSGADAAAKMAILATVAFNTRVALDDVDHTGITEIDPIDVAAARELEMVVRLVGAARLVEGSYDVRVEPAFVDAQHPLAKVDGAFNAVMLQGDAIREITLAGPGAGGTETASAVVADIAGVLGTTGLPPSDPVWRDVPRLPPGESRSPFYFRLFVEDRPGTLAHVAEVLAGQAISVARLVQHQDGSGATLHFVTHETSAGALADALAELEALPEVRRRSRPIPVVSDRGVAELGWA